MYGPNIRAYVRCLCTQQLSPLNRIPVHVSGLDGVPISTGTILEWLQKASEKVEPVTKMINQHLAYERGPVNFDESGAKLDRSIIKKGPKGGTASDEGQPHSHDGNGFSVAELAQLSSQAKFRLVEHRVGEKVPSELVCQALEVIRSSFYAWRRRKSSQRQLANKALCGRVPEIHASSRGTYGSPRIKAQLSHDGFSCGKSRVQNAMAVCGVSGPIRARHVARTTDSNYSMPISNRIFEVEDTTTHPQQPNQVRAEDISLIHTGEVFFTL